MASGCWKLSECLSSFRGVLTSDRSQIQEQLVDCCLDSSEVFNYPFSNGIPACPHEHMRTNFPKSAASRRTMSLYFSKTFSLTKQCCCLALIAADCSSRGGGRPCSSLASGPCLIVWSLKRSDSSRDSRLLSITDSHLLCNTFDCAGHFAPIPGRSRSVEAY